MADSEIMTETSIPTLEEIQSMKVTALKLKLKAFGLSTSGNKSELIERLHEAFQSFCYSSKDSFESSQLGFDESQISELDGGDDGSSPIEDENALLDHDQFSSYISSSLEDDSKVLDSTENKLSAVSNSVIMPPKKRSLIKIAEETPVEKKISINRTNVSLIDFNIKSEAKPDATIDADEGETEEKKMLSLKKMSAAERMAMRAKRFNVTSSSTISVTNSKSSNDRNSKQSILSSSTAPDLDVLKKRAERFGQSVSTVMKQIEQKEKLLKRKCKFGANLGISAISGLGEQAKKRQRAERFGMS